MERAKPLALVLAALCGCAGSRPAEPSAVDRGMLVARVTVRGSLFRFLSKEAESGTIRMLDASGAPMPGGSIPSRPGPDGVVIFTDLVPGRYALTAVSYRARGVRYAIRLPEDAGMARRAVALKPGAAAFLGEHRFDGEWPEDGFKRLLRIVGHWLTPWMRRPVLERSVFIRQQDSGPEAEARAMRIVMNGLPGSRWARIAEARIRELGAPDPAKREGLRGRELPLRHESILGWRDTLKWGEPRRAPTGLEWRSPDSAARVVVFFTTQTAQGFAGFEQAELELRRAAAGSVEDSGEVYDVRVATRAGRAARTTRWAYPDGTLTGSVERVERTETVIVPDGYGVYTARLRAPRDRFESLVPAFREFLLQLKLGPPPPKAPPKTEALLPGGFQ